jgi:chromosome segregation ATPase
MANLSSRIRALEEVVEAVVGQLPAYGEELARLDKSLDRLQSQRTETGVALGRHEEQLQDLAASIKRLGTQVTWIERHIRSTGTARAVDLDLVDPDLSALAATSEAGRRAADDLLPVFARATLESAVATHREAVERRATAQQSLLDSCGALADSGSADAAHRQARTAYLAARSDWVAALRRVEAAAPEAESARARLAEDDDERRRSRPAVAAGQRAEAQLLTRLRTKVASALGDGALLPVWLTAPLGPMPPPEAAQRWMDLAAGLLAYRITYSVTDPDDALGDLPDDASRYHRRWHEDLVRGVRDLRR